MTGTSNPPKPATRTVVVRSHWASHGHELSRVTLRRLPWDTDGDEEPVQPASTGEEDAG
jgi:hypothetical protein